MARLPGSSELLVIESDHNEYNEAERAVLAAGGHVPTGDDAAASAGGGGGVGGAASLAAGVPVGGAMEDDPAAAFPPPPPPPPPPGGGAEGGAPGDDENEDDDEEEDSSAVMGVRGPVPPCDGKWASCVRLLDPKSEETLELAELDNGEAALSLACVVFHSRGGEAFVVVGTARNLVLHPRNHGGCFLRVYVAASLFGGERLHCALETPHTHTHEPFLRSHTPRPSHEFTSTHSNL